jgi:predicted nucleic acid-binding protein
MSSYYFDTSALVKLYVAETGSEWVEHLTSQVTSSGEWTDSILISKLAIVETAAALARRKRERRINDTQQKYLLAKLLRDVNSRYETTTISEMLILHATELTQIHPLRGYDAIQLATALQFNHVLRAKGLQPIIFVAADDILLQAAAAESLNTENPNDHL